MIIIYDKDIISLALYIPLTERTVAQLVEAHVLISVNSSAQGVESSITGRLTWIFF